MSFGLRSFRGWLVVTELALAVVLLLAAGLLVRSFNKLVNIDLGFNRDNVLTARISLPRSTYKDPTQTQAFYDDLLQRLKSLPGIESAGMINHTPLSGFGIIAFTQIEDNTHLDREKDSPLGIGSVSSDYFQTLQQVVVERLCLRRIFISRVWQTDARSEYVVTIETEIDIDEFVQAAQ